MSTSYYFSIECVIYGTRFVPRGHTTLDHLRLQNETKREKTNNIISSIKWREVNDNEASCISCFNDIRNNARKYIIRTERLSIKTKRVLFVNSSIRSIRDSPFGWKNWNEKSNIFKAMKQSSLQYKFWNVEMNVRHGNSLSHF